MASSAPIINLTLKQFIARERDDLTIVSNNLRDAGYLSNVHKRIHDRAILMMYGPRGPKAEGDISLEDEIKAREFQCSNFYSKVETEDEELNPIVVERVDCMADILSKTMQFRRKLENISKKIVVIINGHGKPGYLQLTDNEDVAIEEILKLIKDPLPAEATRHHDEDILGLELPKAVEIVLTQCYGYLYAEEQKKDDIVAVIALTHAGRPTSLFHVYRNRNAMPKGTGNIINSKHWQLDKYAKILSEDAKKTEWDKDSPVVSPKVGGEPMEIGDNL